MKPANYSFSKSSIMMLLISIFILSSCQQDVYDPTYRTPMPDELKDLQTSPDFSWSTTSNVRLDINVNDEYQGQHYYEVSVYDANPFFNENAQLLSKGLAKEGKTFNTLLTIPRDIEDLYICQSMKMKDGSVRRLVKVLPVEGDNLNCDFTNAEYTENTGETTKSIAKAPNKQEDFPDVPKNAIEIKGNSFHIESGKNYIVKEGTAFNGNLSWDWCQGTNIYVLGTFAPKNAQEINGKCTVYIGENGIYKSSKLSINSNSRVYNYGQMDIDHIYITGANCSIDNYNTIVTNKLEATSSSNLFNYQTCNAVNVSLDGGCALLNEGQILTSSEFKMLGGAYLENNCFINAKSLHIEGNKIDIGREAMIVCEDLYGHSAQISLRPNAILDIINNAEFPSGNKILANENNNGSITALVKLGKIKNAGWGGLTFGNKIQVLFKQGNPYNQDYINTKKAIIAESEDATMQIPATGCNGNGNNNQSKDPEGSDFPIIVSPDNSYTFLMEDNWPVYGDYDMNDLVMDIHLKYELEDNNYVDELEITATLRAIGASKPLAAAIQLDKVKRSDVEKAEDDVDDDDNDDKGYSKWAVDGSVFECSNGLENDQEFAVIPLFDNAYKALGVDIRKPTNTILSDNALEEKVFKIEIEFRDNKVRPEDINIHNLNFFIVTDGKKAARKEVHLKGFEPTQKGTRRFFNVHSDAYDTAPYLSADNLIWGLMIPSNKKSPFKYPLEYTNIKDAYPMFEQWVTSSGNSNKDWYKQENAKEGRIYNK